MKTFEFTASVLFNTNRVVSTTEESWESIRENSYIRIGNDETFYNVGKVKPFFYIKDFTVKENREIVVKSDIDINILEGDCLDISFKEFELLTVIKCGVAGEGYKPGELVTIEGGHPVTDSFTGEKQTTTFTVTKVNDNGGILQIQLNKKGRYFIAPEKETIVSGGSGKGASVFVEYTVRDERAIIERTIVKINKNSAMAVLSLDAPLPIGVSEGKLSANKWEMFLTGNYAGETKINQVYSITRDFTPVVGIPLLVKGSQNSEATYNLAATVIDKKLKECLDRIAALEKLVT